MNKDEKKLLTEGFRIQLIVDIEPRLQQESSVLCTLFMSACTNQLLRGFFEKTGQMPDMAEISQLQADAASAALLHLMHDAIALSVKTSGSSEGLRESLIRHIDNTLEKLSHPATQTATEEEHEQED